MPLGQSGRSPLYTLELRGASHERGMQHGRALAVPIRQAVEFYRSFFAEHVGIDAAEMRRRAARYIEPTAELSPLLMREYEGIAAGSGHTLEDIFALSARYEITFETVKLGECSNVYVGAARSASGHALLGMNWEWRPEVLDFRAVLLNRCEDQPDQIIVTECGQPGKYGINEHGLAIVETGLACSRNTSGGRQLFAALIRHGLAQERLDEAAAIIREHPPEATISFFLADDAGPGLNLEISPFGIAERTMAADEIRWHTNHCLLRDEPCSFEDSFVRGRRWDQLIASARSKNAADGRASPVDWHAVGGWLADTTDGEQGICRVPNPALRHSTTWLATLSSIVIDVGDRALWISDGPSSYNPYARFDLKTSCAL